MSNGKHNSDNKDIYKEPAGTVVSFGFRLPKSSIPAGHSFKKELQSLIKQAIFLETTFAKQAGRYISFGEPKIVNKKDYSDVMIDGVLGDYVAWDVTDLQFAK